MNKIESGFDCLAFKQRSQDELCDSMAGMSHEEQVRFLRIRAERGPLASWWKLVRSSREKKRLEVRRKAG